MRYLSIVLAMAMVVAAAFCNCRRTTTTTGTIQVTSTSSRSAGIQGLTFASAEDEGKVVRSLIGRTAEEAMRTLGQADYWSAVEASFATTEEAVEALKKITVMGETAAGSVVRVRVIGPLPGTLVMTIINGKVTKAHLQATTATSQR